jgi:hypothetical protein
VNGVIERMMGSGVFCLLVALVSKSIVLTLEDIIAVIETTELMKWGEFCWAHESKTFEICRYGIAFESDIVGARVRIEYLRFAITEFHSTDVAIIKVLSW